MTEYLNRTVRETTVAARLTLADRRLVEAAAAARGAPSLSSYIAAVATKAAWRDLLGQEPRKDTHDG